LAQKRPETRRKDKKKQRRVKRIARSLKVVSFKLESSNPRTQAASLSGEQAKKEQENRRRGRDSKRREEHRRAYDLPDGTKGKKTE